MPLSSGTKTVNSGTPRCPWGCSAACEQAQRSQPLLSSRVGVSHGTKSRKAGGQGHHPERTVGGRWGRRGWPHGGERMLQTGSSSDQDKCLWRNGGWCCWKHGPQAGGAASAEVECQLQLWPRAGGEGGQLPWGRGDITITRFRVKQGLPKDKCVAAK